MATLGAQELRLKLVLVNPTYLCCLDNEEGGKNVWGKQIRGVSGSIPPNTMVQT